MALPPLIIFKGTKLSTRWINGNILASLQFACNSKGWTSNEYGIKWLWECFEPLTWEKAASKYWLLIYNDYSVLNQLTSQTAIQLAINAIAEQPW